MKNALRTAFAVLGIAAIAAPSAYAMSDITYTVHRPMVEYKVLLDNESYRLPDEVEYPDGHRLNLDTFKNTLSSLTSSTIKYENGIFTFNGGVTLTTTHNEYLPYITAIGGLNYNISDEEIIKNYETYHLLAKRKNDKSSYETALIGTTDERTKKEYNIRISNYAEDIARMESNKVPAASKRLLSAMPYLSASGTIVDRVDINNETLSSDIDLQYYVYSIVYRDLRLNALQYKINDGSLNRIMNFDKDKYTYTVKLPDTVPNNATISSASTGYVAALLDYNNIKGYNTGIEVEDDTIQLKNGYGTLKVKVTFNMLHSYGEYIGGYTSNPQKVYTINFTKHDFLKGDLDRDGHVNADDAAVALDLYKYHNETAEDIAIGDMDGDGHINADDAALILDVYKYGL